MPFLPASALEVSQAPSLYPQASILAPSMILSAFSAMVMTTSAPSLYPAAVMIAVWHSVPMVSQLPMTAMKTVKTLAPSILLASVSSEGNSLVQQSGEPKLPAMRPMMREHPPSLASSQVLKLSLVLAGLSSPSHLASAKHLATSSRTQVSSVNLQYLSTSAMKVLVRSMFLPSVPTKLLYTMYAYTPASTAVSLCFSKPTVLRWV